MSGFSILPIKFSDTQNDIVAKSYRFVLENRKTRFSTLEDFKTFKRREAELEDNSEFLIVDSSDPIGLIQIKKLYEQPKPIFTLSTIIPEKDIDSQLKEVVGKWLVEQLDDREADRIIAYESRAYMEQFYMELGGRIANCLQFYELEIDEVDMVLLDLWDDSSMLAQSHLKLQYFSEIPDQLLEEHAKLHTELSNDIKRKDYSWKVIKTASYTRNRQKLLHLQGNRAEIGYLIDQQEHIVGMTKMVFDPKTPEKVCQTVTGVTKALRGKALAKLLKANMINRIANHYPQVKVVETDCMRGNEPMISINKKVGFRRKLVPDEKEIILEKLFLHQNQKCI